jgi:hypothetical protein
VFLKLFGMNEATLMRGPPDGGKRSARTDNALHGAGADVGDPCVYRKLKPGRNGDEARRVSGVNE